MPEESQENGEKIKVEVKTEEEAKEEAKFRNPWIYSTVILVLILIALAGMQMTGMLTAGDGAIQTTVQNQISSQDAGQKALDFINNNLVQPGTTVTLGSVAEMSGVYNVTTTYAGNDIPVYITKDGRYLIVPGIGAIDIDNFEAPEPVQPQEPEPQPSEIPKSDRPVLDVFIMSYCPYGLQAAKAVTPVQELLGESADINIRFVQYTMHGQEEEDENYRMMCIREEEPEKFWQYMECFTGSGDSGKCTAESGIDTANLEDCMENRASGYYDEDKLLDSKYAVGGSPTFVLNEKVISVTRSPEAVKQEICNAFNTMPEECSQTLSTAQASPGFGSGTSTGSSGSCG